MDSQIKKRLTHVVMHNPYLNMNPRGQKVYGPPVQLMGYIEGKMTMVRNREGEEVVSSKRVYLDGYLKISTLDTLLLDDGEVAYPIVAVSPFDGLKKGTGTTVVYL